MKKIYFLLAAILILAPSLTFAYWSLPSSQGLPTSPIYYIIETILRWILGIFGFIAIIAFAISGIMYLTAAGDENQIAKAKKAMTYSIVGVVVALSGYIILQAINAALSGGSYF